MDVRLFPSAASFGGRKLGVVARSLNLFTTGLRRKRLRWGFEHPLQNLVLSALLFGGNHDTRLPALLSDSYHQYAG